jgi:hypothetical protein
MIQRIQTIYLLVAVAALTACLCLPIGQFVAPKTGEPMATLYNLWIHLPSQIGDTLGAAAVSPEDAEPMLASEAAGHHLFTPWALFAVLLIATAGMAFSIFIFKQRLVQSRLVMLCMILIIGWYAVYTAFAFILPHDMNLDFRPTVWAALPAIALICGYLAFRAILKDEMLVRSLDRLR